MSKIKVLSNQIINQIAAGEIIERPFAVVRELVDNSLDAASENIKVILEGGGIQRIEVVDDGRGISEDEIELAITRHATSKIEKETDLVSIASLGFRGEALASIASVSQFSIESSDNENNTACKISLFGGSKKDLIVTNRKQGTSVTVKNIFFNVPARKKFLKKSTTEQLKITNWLKQISLTRPDVSFSLISDSKEILRFPKADSIKERAKKVFKDSNFAFLERLSGDYKLSVYLSPPIDAKQKSTTTNILVNKRVVNDSTLLRAIKEAYGNTLKPREYPQGFIHLEVPPHEIDVNVHPQKSEVRFIKQSFVFQFVMQTITECLSNFLSGEKFKSEDYLLNETSLNVSESSSTVPNFGYINSNLNLAEKIEVQPIDKVIEAPKLFDIEVDKKNVKPSFLYSNLVYQGRIFKCYLLCEYLEDFYVIDMHAAHERVNYNKILVLLKNKNINAQKLLLPEILNFREEEVLYCLEHKDIFFELGFEVDAFSKDSLIVRSTPATLGKINIKLFFEDALDSELPQTISEKYNRELEHLAARMACHSSLRTGDDISKIEANILFEELDKAELANACPHGRPIYRKFSKNEIEKWFGRIK